MDMREDQGDKMLIFVEKVRRTKSMANEWKINENRNLCSKSIYLRWRMCGRKKNIHFISLIKNLMAR